MTRTWIVLAASALILPMCGLHAEETGRHTRPQDAVVYIQSPADGAVVPERFVVRFGLRNMGVAPAGIDRANTGHHHLLIDTDLPPLDAPIPSDAKHVHFGNGQTETTISLPPGKHTLQLLLGDWSHVPHDPPLYSDKITVEVAAGAAPPK